MGEGVFLAVRDAAAHETDPALNEVKAMLQAPRSGCRVFANPEEKRAAGVLYAVHELVHNFQGIAEKGDVRGWPVARMRRVRVRSGRCQ